MGPVRHLGLSRAVGEVSAYVELSLGWSDAKSSAAASETNAEEAAQGGGDASLSSYAISEVNSSEESDDHDELDDRKPAALPLQQRQQEKAVDLMSMNLRDAAAQNLQKTAQHDDEDDDGGGGKKPAAVSTEDNHVESMHDLDSSTTTNGKLKSGSNVHRSSTVHRSNNPIWPTVQRNGNRSLFDIRLHKRRYNNANDDDDDDKNSKRSGRGGGGRKNTDGQRIQLRLVVKEEMTGLENAIPDPFGLGLTRGGIDGAGSSGGTIGMASVDVTELALGCCEGVEGEKENEDDENSSGNARNGGGDRGTGGVIDAWADLTLPVDTSHTGVARSAAHAAVLSGSSEAKEEPKASHKRTGRVRVLVSYEPHGMDPRRGDVAALECFARRDPSKSSCRILIPPLSPLRVLDVIGSHCFVEYDLPQPDMEALTTRDRKKQYATDNDHHSQNSNRDRNGGGNSSTRKTGRARIHRNSIFVIERTNAVDGAVNLALAPVDAYLSTPLGRATSQIAGPLLDAAGELIAPAMLTGRLMLASVNTVGAVGLNSAGAIASTVVRSLDSNSDQRLDDRDPLSKV